MSAVPVVRTATIPLPPASPLQLLPSGFALPPLPYLVGLAAAVAAVVALLRRADPEVTPAVVAGFPPWMVAGAAGYALFQVDGVPDPVAPLFGSPAVYLTTFVLAGPVWAALDARGLPVDSWSLRSVPGLLLASGTGIAGAVVGLAFVAAESLRPLLPGAGLLVAVGLALPVWVALRRSRPVTRAAGPAGLVLVFGHVLDGVSTAMGVDIMEFGERTPLSRIIIDYAATLPTAEVIGSGWLFLLLKLLLALFVLVAFKEYVEEMPTRARVVLLVVAALGLGPGAHNMLLFTVNQSVSGLGV